MEDPIEDPARRARELAGLGHIERHMYVEIAGAKVYAESGSDVERTKEDGKTSSVHFVRFEFPPALREAIRAGAAVKLGCDHTNYPAHVHIAAETLASLAGDLSAA